MYEFCCALIFHFHSHRLENNTEFSFYLLSRCINSEMLKTCKCREFLLIKQLAIIQFLFQKLFVDLRFMKRPTDEKKKIYKNAYFT